MAEIIWSMGMAALTFRNRRGEWVDVTSVAAQNLKTGFRPASDRVVRATMMP